MPSTITLNTIPNDDSGPLLFLSNTGLTNNVIYADTMYRIISDSNFSSIFKDNSFNPNKLAPIPGNRLLSKTLSGSKDSLNGNQIAWYSVDTIDIASEAIDNRTIKSNTITNSKLVEMPPYTLKANNTGSLNSPSDLSMSANSVVARQGNGSIVSLSADAGHTLRRNGSGNLEFGLINETNLDTDSKFSPGMIVMWSGTFETIPVGWGLCNGTIQTYRGRTTVTPNLINKFIVGRATNGGSNPGGGFIQMVGGSPTHSHAVTVLGTSLSLSQIPPHTHTVNDPGHTHTDNLNYGSNMGAGNGIVGNDYVAANFINAATTGITINSSGGSNGVTLPHSHSTTVTSESNIPPFYALAFIIKL